MKSTILAQLMRKDLLQIFRCYPAKFFDTCFLFFTNVVVFSYFMPAFGVSSDLGPFIVVGAIASFGLFDIVGQVGELIVDIQGDRAIYHRLAMPIPYWLVFFQLVLKWGLSTILLCTPLIFVGKLLVWDRFFLSDIHFFKLLLIYPTAALFFGFFSLWLTSIIEKATSLSSLFLRFINPLFMFGGYFFTWKSTLAISPILGYTLLANPMIYVMEGMRSAILGPEGYLPFWTSFFVLWGFNFLLAAISISRLKRRLDCV